MLPESKVLATLERSEGSGALAALGAGVPSDRSQCKAPEAAGDAWDSTGDVGGERGRSPELENPAQDAATSLSPGYGGARGAPDLASGPYLKHLSGEKGP